MKAVLFTDGGAWPNPGPGAWAYLLAMVPNSFDPLVGDPKEHSWVAAWDIMQGTTNNQMELTAAIKGLAHVTKTRTIQTLPLFVITDSLYLKTGAEKGPVDPERMIPNRDLWEQVWAWSGKTKPNWIHVRGHQGVPGNEHVDRYCTRIQKKEIDGGRTRWT